MYQTKVKYVDSGWSADLFCAENKAAMLQIFAVLLSLALIQPSAATTERALSYLPAIISEDQQIPLRGCD